MMRKKVILLPVGYHKIQSFYETWLQSNSGVAFVSIQEELTATLSSLLSPKSDLQSMFIEYADPAFNEFLLRR